VDKFDRIFQLDAILSARRTPIAADELMARLECSRSTLFRIIASMKDHLGAPIEFDAAMGGFRYQRLAGRESYQLPGLWFSPAELQCLAVLQRLMGDLGGGFLAEQVALLGRRLTQLLANRRLNLV
jgi:proteasome accessory factor C